MGVLIGQDSPRQLNIANRFLSFIEFNSLPILCLPTNGHGNSPKQKRWRRKELSSSKDRFQGKRHFMDEINRTPPKTQSALLEAMQEKRVTVAGTNHQLQEPFFVLATQNPIEQEGTYPLPEAQLDRFMFLIRMDYLSETRKSPLPGKPRPALCQNSRKSFPEEIEGFPATGRKGARSRPCSRIGRRSCTQNPPQFGGIPAWLKSGSNGAQVRSRPVPDQGAKARAVLEGNYMISMEDAEKVADPVLFHRILTNFHARSEGITSTEAVQRLIEDARKECGKDMARRRKTIFITPIKILSLGFPGTFAHTFPDGGSVSGHHRSPHKGSSVEFAGIGNTLPEKIPKEWIGECLPGPTGITSRNSKPKRTFEPIRLRLQRFHEFRLTHH